jgi:hypothetical protein
VSDLAPTEYITQWLLNAPDYLREDAIWRARHAIATGYPGDREHFLNMLETLVGYTWNYSEHEAVSDHIRQLRSDLTYDQIEGADWLAIARAITTVGEAGHA